MSGAIEVDNVALLEKHLRWKSSRNPKHVQAWNNAHHGERKHQATAFGCWLKQNDP
jgi:hypothetical protein